jgi:hypothetical protein
MRAASITQTQNADQSESASPAIVELQAVCKRYKHFRWTMSISASSLERLLA